MGSFSIWHWLIVLLVVVLVFGTKKLRNMGTDLGSAVKGFKDGLKEGKTPDIPEVNTTKEKLSTTKQNSDNTINVEVKDKS